MKLELRLARVPRYFRVWILAVLFHLTTAHPNYATRAMLILDSIPLTRSQVNISERTIEHLQLSTTWIIRKPDMHVINIFPASSRSQLLSDLILQIAQTFWLRYLTSITIAKIERNSKCQTFLCTVELTFKLNKEWANNTPPILNGIEWGRAERFEQKRRLISTCSKQTVLSPNRPLRGMEAWIRRYKYLLSRIERRQVSTVADGACVNKHATLTFEQ